MKKIRLLLILLFFILIINTVSGEIIGHREEDAVRVFDEEGNYIFGTTMGVSVGDKYIDEDNIEYLILTVDGNRAVCERKGQVDLLVDIGVEVNILSPIAAQGSKKIGLYHTHNGESYLPGPVNIDGKGDIHEVGDALKEALEKKGISVNKLNALHLPHDGAAYERSRATVAELVQTGPDAIFDIHRDGIPSEEEYLKEVNGQLISQVRIVVGRQNPNQQVNDQFARRLKAIADEQYPGLIKGIFYGRGNYNQHVAPHSLLLEFGTHVTTKEQAVASAHMIADSISQLLYGGGEEAKESTAGENRSIFSTIAWIIGITAILVLLYLFINEGSIDGVRSRIKNFFKREIK